MTDGIIQKNFKKYGLEHSIQMQELIEEIKNNFTVSLKPHNSQLLEEHRICNKYALLVLIGDNE